ncbi:MAG TPA: hypothetical protein VMV27_05875 [Candidatus Binataceae bacterium]|nr:hypothetical protein [Candidatus Binataceae bacterium]
MKRGGRELHTAAMLTHFTRASKTASALDNLIAILEAGTIRGGRRMVRGGAPAVCLFDIALSDLRAILVRKNRRRYEPFGIAIDRRHAFAQGARPVIYLPWREAREIVAPREHWRIVNLEIDRNPAVDWTHEREWRVLGELPLDPRRSAALVDSWRDVDAIYDHFGGHPPCAGVIPLRELFGNPA